MNWGYLLPHKLKNYQNRVVLRVVVFVAIIALMLVPLLVRVLC